MVVLAVVLVLSVIGFVVIKQSRQVGKMKRCQLQLKQVTLAMKMWIGDSTFDPPWARDVQGTKTFIGNGLASPHFSTLSNQIGETKTLICPGDNRIPATSWSALTDSNISYFVNVDSHEWKPNRVAFGDRLLVSSDPPKNGMVTLATNGTYGWEQSIHNGQGTLSRGDGSVQQFTSTELTKELTRKENIGSRIQLPR
jgi:hypothetical protein